ncbi:hypothetical protein FBU30_009025, partial [Linnemannia zychae]
MVEKFYECHVKNCQHFSFERDGIADLTPGSKFEMTLPSHVKPALILLLAAFCLAQLVLASPDYYIKITNNDGSKSRNLEVLYGYRQCFCISKTQTAKIDARYAGMDTKLFSTNDCTGNWADGTGKITSNAQWVNSVSFGRSGISSSWGDRRCDWY